MQSQILQSLLMEDFKIHCKNCKKILRLGTLELSTCTGWDVFSSLVDFRRYKGRKGLSCFRFIVLILFLMRRAEISATSILDKYILLSLLVLVLVVSMPKYYGFSRDRDLASHLLLFCYIFRIPYLTSCGIYRIIRLLQWLTRHSVDVARNSRSHPWPFTWRVRRTASGLNSTPGAADTHTSQ